MDDRSCGVEVVVNPVRSIAEFDRYTETGVVCAMDEEGTADGILGAIVGWIAIGGISRAFNEDMDAINCGMPSRLSLTGRNCLLGPRNVPVIERESAAAGFFIMVGTGLGSVVAILLPFTSGTPSRLT